MASSSSINSGGCRSRQSTWAVSVVVMCAYMRSQASRVFSTTNSSAPQSVTWILDQLTVLVIQRVVSDRPTTEPCIFQRLPHLRKWRRNPNHCMRRICKHRKSGRPRIMSKGCKALGFREIPDGCKISHYFCDSFIKSLCFCGRNLERRILLEISQACQCDICFLSGTNGSSLKAAL